MHSNLKPADELASIRQKIKDPERFRALMRPQSLPLAFGSNAIAAPQDSVPPGNALKAREKELRTGMLDGSIGMSGEYTKARFVTRTSKRLNRKLLEDELGDISRFLVETEAKYLKLEDIEDDDDWQVIE